MRFNRKLLSILLLVALLFSGVLPSAAAAELSASYETASYHDIGTTAYSRMLLFQDGVVAAANAEGKYGLIDIYGAVKVPFQYDYLEATGGGYFVATQGGQMGIIDTNGEIVLPLTMKHIGTQNNILRCVDSNYVVTYYTEDMRPASEHDYEGTASIQVDGYYSVTELTNGYYLAHGNEGGMAILGHDFQPVVPIGQYDTLSLLGSFNGMPYLSARVKSGQTCVIDATGKVVVPLGNYFTVGDVNPSGMLAVSFRSGNSYLSQLYDLSAGKEVKRWNDREVSTAENFRDLIFSLDGENYGTMDEAGNVIISPQFYRINTAGNPDFVLVSKFDFSAPFFYWQGLYTADGQQILAPQYEKIEYLGEDNYLVYDGDCYGIADGTGQFVVPLIYKWMTVHSSSFIEAKGDDGTYTVLDLTGREVIPCSLERLYIYDDNDNSKYYNLANYSSKFLPEDGYEGNILPFRVKTVSGYETYYVDWETGESLGSLPVLASNITSDGRFVYRDEETGLYGFGRLNQGSFPNPHAPDSGCGTDSESYVLQSAHGIQTVSEPVTYTYTYPNAQALDVTFSTRTDITLNLNDTSYAPSELAGQTVRIDGDTLTVVLPSFVAESKVFGFAVEKVEAVGTTTAAPAAAAVYTASGSSSTVLLSGVKNGETVRISLIGETTDQESSLLGALYDANGILLDLIQVPVLLTGDSCTASLNFDQSSQAVTFKLFLTNGSLSPEMANLTFTD